MPRLTIQQFRATLAAGDGDGTLVRAYRELARRPDLASALRTTEWAAWPSAVTSTPAA
jgi:hypothetical protein